MAATEELRHAIEHGDARRIEALLRADPDAANRPICWGEGQKNVSDPLHYVSDCCFNGVLTNGSEAEITRLLLASGAALDGNEGQETPLIGATSLGVAAVAEVLIQAGARTDPTSLFGASALHWAAYMGMPAIVRLLLERGAERDRRCSAFNATPLFWAVQGFSRYGPKVKSDQLGAAKVLLDAGADASTENFEGHSASERAEEAESPSMQALLAAHLPN